MRIYFGTVAWGWIMYGIGYKSKWFLGFSMSQYGERALWGNIPDTDIPVMPIIISSKNRNRRLRRSKI